MPRKPGSSEYNKPRAAKKAAAPVRRHSSMASSNSGRGFYKGFGKHLGTALGTVGGHLASAFTGVPGLGALGGQIGGAAGAFGSRLTGWGAYRINRNSLVPGIPSIHNPRKEGATQVRHTEYIGDVLSSTGFQTQYVVDINAALQASFPWLLSIARNYQQFEVNGMVFTFRPTSGSAVSSTNNAMGEVIMATNYNSVDSAFTNKLQMLNTEFSCSTVPFNQMIHPIECAPQQTSVNILYTREGTIPAGSDPRFWDLGKFQLATSGQQQADITLGELWVSYDVLLYKPILVDDIQTFARWKLVGITSGAVFGTSFRPVVDSLSQNVVVDANNIYISNDTSQPMSYVIDYFLNDTSSNPVFTTPLTLTNCTHNNIFNNDATWAHLQTQSDAAQLSISVTIPPNPAQDATNNATINYGAFTCSGTVPYADLRVTLISDGL